MPEVNTNATLKTSVRHGGRHKGNSLKEYKRHAKKCARELCYGASVVEAIEHADSANEIEYILRNTRKSKGGGLR